MSALADTSVTARRGDLVRRTLGSVTVLAEGRKLLRLEVRNAETPIERKPAVDQDPGDDGPGVPASCSRW